MFFVHKFTRLKRFRFTLFLSIALLIATILVLLIPSRPSGVAYQGKPLEIWFYGGRTNFFYQTTIENAQLAIDSLGTNALPFLLGNLEENHGSSRLYFKFYQILPARFQQKFSYPLSDDDIKMRTLSCLLKMSSFPPEQLGLLARDVSRLNNPAVRFKGLGLVSAKFLNDAFYLEQCRKLLDDPHPGIQLRGAIALGQSAIAGDPHEGRIFPLLIEALENQEKLKASVALDQYLFQQRLGSAAARFRIPRRPPNSEDPAEALRREITTALYRLEPYLGPEQRFRFHQGTK